jgi:hypothetical protein
MVAGWSFDCVPCRLNGERHILVRSLDATVPARITTTDQNPSHLFWSHDGASYLLQPRKQHLVRERRRW